MLPWFADGAYPLYLAPMARFTDVAFRQLCKEQGADVMVTEFVMADSLISGGEESWRSVDFTEEQRPMGVQVFGSSPERMAEAARRIEARVRPDFIDINCGCPADKVTDQAAGSSLLREPDKLAKITEAIVQAVHTPVTVKIRIGWDEDSVVAPEVGRLVESAGAQALAIHGRTKMQRYSGKADWKVINAVAAELSIPVVGNGDVSTCKDVVRIREESPVSGLMIGRAAMGYPWLFKEIKHYLATGEIPEAPTIPERWSTILRFAELLLSTQFKHKDPNDIRWMRAKLKALTKDMPGSRKVRAKIDTIVSLDELKAFVASKQELTTP
ncbi:tRNA dihydrouridine synthase DusB [Rubellicoccus peritrichatus]|uniref:tRNA-dihydrouridine synthase n=1 Tax=Rubellicoccus peritrichatus TaxID=3080537 RepID=A0AAQ3QRH2_9BACT|nr:tRNA dihydrouridine synthase DusB [Puniceicoccus sp. CR14]WOO39376.1 tRNA dihydrouridine synthase DusB [Puniceicoccus sp. CR14]